MSNLLLRKIYKKYSCPQDDLEVLLYGQAVLMFNVFVFLFIFLEGILLNNIVFTSLWITMFIALRIHLGGYHCKSKIGCFIMTNVVYLSSYFFNYYFEYIQWYIIVLFIVIILKFFKEFQYVKRKKKVLVIMIIELSIGILLKQCFVPVILSILENVVSFMACKDV